TLLLPALHRKSDSACVRICGHADLDQEPGEGIEGPTETKRVPAQVASPPYCVGFTFMIVASIDGISFSSPSLIANASAPQTVMVRPARFTRARATNFSPTAGDSRFTLNST